MSTISSLVGSGGTSSFIDSMLSTSSTTSSSSTTSTGGLVDYALIKSGAYKKLMSAYYAEQSSSGSSSTDSETTLKTTQNSAKDLAKSASALQKSSSYTEDNREELLKSLKSFVEDYNSLIESTDDLNDTSSLRNVLWLTQQTSANENLLNEIGISINSDNTLEIDEDTFNNANLSTMKSLFTGSSSYASQVVTKAAAVYSAASSALNSTGTGSAYTSSGKYASLTTGSIIDSIT